MKTFFYSGAFDPFSVLDTEAVFNTLLDGSYNKVVIGIELDSKRPALFSLAKRTEMIKQSLEWYAKANFPVNYEHLIERISIVSYHGLPIYEAKKHGADMFLIATDETKTYNVKFSLSRQIARNKLSCALCSRTISR